MPNTNLPIRRDTDKGLSNIQLATGLQAVEESIFTFIRDEISPSISNLSSGARQAVPMRVGDAEMWADVLQQNSRDPSLRIEPPIGIWKRESISLDQTIYFGNHGQKNTDRILIPVQNAQTNRIAKWYHQGVQDVKEYYSVTYPKFHRIRFTLTFWLNYPEHVNDIIEQFSLYHGAYLGMGSARYCCMFEEPQVEIMNGDGSDRTYLLTISFESLCSVLGNDTTDTPNVKKITTPNRVVALIETDEDDLIAAEKYVGGLDERGRSLSVDFTTYRPTFNNTVTEIQTGGGGGVSPATLQEVAQFLAMNNLFYGEDITGTTADFDCVVAVPPTGYTLVSEVRFYCNGLLIEPNAITSFSQVTVSNVIKTRLTINSAALGYTFESTDEILVTGKVVSN